MRYETPDDQGWWWVETKHDGWSMAYVDTGREKVFLFDGHEPPDFSRMNECELDTVAHDIGALRWFGPINCPGGPFGSDTIIISAERHDDAANEGKAIVLRHVDFSHLKGEGTHGQITVSGMYTRSEARGLIDVDLLGFERD